MVCENCQMCRVTHISSSIVSCLSHCSTKQSCLNACGLFDNIMPYPCVANCSTCYIQCAHASTNKQPFTTCVSLLFSYQASGQDVIHNIIQNSVNIPLHFNFVCVDSQSGIFTYNIITICRLQCIKEELVRKYVEYLRTNLGVNLFIRCLSPYSLRSSTAR